MTFELLLSILLLAVPAPLVNFGSAETEALGNGVDSHSGPVRINEVLLLKHLHLCLSQSLSSLLDSCWRAHLQAKLVLGLFVVFGGVRLTVRGSVHVFWFCTRWEHLS